eukprot:Lankesteria_metandrocarpae@DN10987_c0_g1_i1.p1
MRMAAGGVPDTGSAYRQRSGDDSYMTATANTPVPAVHTAVADGSEDNRAPRSAVTATAAISNQQYCLDDMAFEALCNSVLRLTLVIVHDYPQFFALYGASLAARLPPRATQLRNLLLSAYSPTRSGHKATRGGDLPSPFDASRLVELNESPPSTSASICSSDAVYLLKSGIKAALDSYEHRRRTSIATILSEIRTAAAVDTTNFTVLMDVTLQYTVNYFFGPDPKLVSLLRLAAASTGSTSTGTGSATTSMDDLKRHLSVKKGFSIVQSLFGLMTPEERETGLAALGNRVRFPSSETGLYATLLVSL